MCLLGIINGFILNDMKADYRFKKRKGRNIQVIYKNLPGQEISTGTVDEAEAVKFDFRILTNALHIKLILSKNMQQVSLSMINMDIEKDLRKRRNSAHGITGSQEKE